MLFRSLPYERCMLMHLSGDAEPEMAPQVIAKQEQITESSQNLRKTIVSSTSQVASTNSRATILNWKTNLRSPSVLNQPRHAGEPAPEWARVQLKTVIFPTVKRDETKAVAETHPWRSMLKKSTSSLSGSFGAVPQAPVVPHEDWKSLLKKCSRPSRTPSPCQSDSVLPEWFGIQLKPSGSRKFSIPTRS